MHESACARVGPDGWFSAGALRALVTNVYLCNECSELSISKLRCEQMINTYRSQWVNCELYQGLNISPALCRVAIILRPPEHAP